MTKKSNRPQRRHVTPRDGGKRWADTAAGAKRAAGVYDTQREAQAAARERLRRSGGGELTTHGRDGRIRDSDTVGGGNDPFPPRDKR